MLGGALAFAVWNAGRAQKVILMVFDELDAFRLAGQDYRNLGGIAFKQRDPHIRLGRFTRILVSAERA